MVRFGSEDEISSPAIMQANADLVLAFEPLEAVRAVYYARREKTAFVIDDHPYVPIYSHLLDIPYPSIDEIKERITPFAREIHIFSARKVAREEFKNPIFGNTILLGAALGLELLPLKEDSLKKAIEVSAPRGIEENLSAFERGLMLGRTLKGGEK